MPPITINPIGTAAFLVSEANGYRSREVGVISAGQGKLPPGMVLEPSAVVGEETEWIASNGGNTAAAILYEEIDTGTDAGAAGIKRTIIVRDCEVQKSALAFVGGPNQAAIDAALGNLATKGVAFR